MNRQNQPFEEEPPSYDHAVQAGLSEEQVHQFGLYADASEDSYEQGERFISAFQSQIDTFPLMEAQEVGERGLVNSLSINTNVLNNQVFGHPKGGMHNPGFIFSEKSVLQFWPAKQHAEPDLDISAQATHPFLMLSEYRQQQQQMPTEHYYEITIESKAPDVVLGIGLSTRPYPTFRMPGWNKFSVGYHSDDGHKFCDDATGGQGYGPSYGKGDTVGCGYSPETGNVFFTKNGTFLGYAYQSLERHHYFASIGADGPARLRVNFGREPFRFNVNQWVGLFI